MNIKYLITLSAIGAISYQSYTRFKDFINNIKVSTLNFVKNLDETFTVDLIVANSLMSIIPYKIAEIKLIDDSNTVIATATNPWELDKTTNIQFLMNVPDAISDINQARSLDVEITFNFFLFQHKRKYQQIIISNEQLIASNSPNQTNSQIVAENFIAPITNAVNEFTQNGETCNCKPI